MVFPRRASIFFDFKGRSGNLNFDAVREISLKFAVTREGIEELAGGPFRRFPSVLRCSSNEDFHPPSDSRLALRKNARVVKPG